MAPGGTLDERKSTEPSRPDTGSAAVGKHSDPSEQDAHKPEKPIPPPDPPQPDRQGDGNPGT
jgi:hypothetical protein